MHLPFLLATGSWLIFVERTWTALVDVTIDDTYGDPNTGAQIMYMPDNWNNGTSCSACTAHPASSQTYLGTWHDNTWNPPANSTEAAEVQTASAAFNGSAVYIFCIIAHSLVSPDGNTNMTFYIDDETVGHYALLPSGAQPTYSYNINVYLNTSVPPGQHTIKIQNGPLGQKALVLLDYITYSYDDGTLTVNPSTSTASSSHKFRTATIASATVAALVFLLLLAFLIRRRRLQWLKDPRNGFVIDAFLAPAADSGCWVAVSDLASRQLARTPSQPSPSGPPRRVDPEVSQVAQEGLIPSAPYADRYPYVIPDTNRPSGNSANFTRGAMQWSGLSNPRQVQRQNRKLPALPNTTGSMSVVGAEGCVPQDDPPAYSDAGRDFIARDGIGVAF